MVIKTLILEKIKCKEIIIYENTVVERDPRDHKAKKLVNIIPTMNYKPQNEQKGIVIFPVTQYITLSIYSPHKELPCCGNYHCCFHYVKIVRIGSFSGLYFPVYGLNIERYSISLQIQSKYGKIWTRKTEYGYILRSVSYRSTCIKSVSIILVPQTILLHFCD